LSAPQKGKQNYHMTRNSTPGYRLEELETDLNKHTYTHKSQKAEITQYPSVGELINCGMHIQ
jgi:hypothetical protein